MAFTALVATRAALVTGQQLTAARTIPLVVPGIAMLLPLEAIVGTSTALSAWQASQQRVRSVLDAPRLPEPDRTGIVAPRIADHRIDFDDVCFGYPGRGPLLRGVDLEIVAAGTTALVGVSGSGKTTLTKLIARFHDGDSGAVRIGGVDVRDPTACEVLDQVSVVFQDVFLLDTTIEENIRVGNPPGSASALPSHGRCAKTPDRSSRRGDRLAGHRERCGRAGRDRGTGPRSYVLIIAHRLETVAAADRIAVLHSGRIIESGTHTELLGAAGRYAEFWNQRHRADGSRLSNR
ncbi:hypothetical protein GCM10011575_13090 [Microlunatus endophyticus]|uniref:ABC transporter domain-containing protein n=1 Tax=Microlunatus endophyticus TaxID=1716077 RepID=A0A917S4B2_9ACTN|nr:ABC transporter ATP-binding protein [Microlunatus endophyticus]GGL56086.1 hypothetical protein GCM10011575_13090 [Microlunatus endophyticus]